MSEDGTPKGYAYIESEDLEIQVSEELIVGDYIRWFPNENEEFFTDEYADNGMLMVVLKRVYSTIDGMQYFCELVEENNH